MKRLLFISIILSCIQARANTTWSEYFLAATEYYKAHEFDSAYANYIEVISNSSTPDSIKAESHTRMGEINYFLHRYPKSIKSFNSAIRYFNKQHDLRNIEKCNSSLANVYVKLGKYQEAEQLYLSRIEYSKANDKKGDELSTRINLSGLYNHSGQFENSLKQLSSAFALASELGDTLKLQMAFNNLSALYINSDMPDSALRIIDRLMIETPDLYLKNSLYKNLFRLYQHLGNLDSTVKYLQLYHSTSNHLKRESVLLTISKLEMERDKAQLEKEEAQLTSIVSILLSLLLIGLVLWVMDKRNSKRKEYEYQVLTDVLVGQLQTFERDKTEIGSIFHSDLSPTLIAVRIFLDIGELTKTRRYLVEAIQKLDELQNNRFYSKRFKDYNWLEFVPSNLNHNSKWIELIRETNPEIYTEEFQITAFGVVEQILQDVKHKLFIDPRETGIEITSTNEFVLSKNTKALLSFFNCKVGANNIVIPNPSNKK